MTGIEPGVVEFGGVCPVLRVERLADTLPYYVDVLGFRVDWRYPLIASVSRGRCCIFLSEGDQGHAGGWTWIGVSDVDALHDELVGRGARIRNPPRNFFWGREMQVADPDGNVLRMCSDPRPGELIGPWRDMHGYLWHAARRRLGARGRAGLNGPTSTDVNGRRTRWKRA